MLGLWSPTQEYLVSGFTIRVKIYHPTVGKSYPGYTNPNSIGWHMASTGKGKEETKFVFWLKAKGGYLLIIPMERLSLRPRQVCCAAQAA